MEANSEEKKLKFEEKIKEVLQTKRKVFILFYKEKKSWFPELQ